MERAERRYQQCFQLPQRETGRAHHLSSIKEDLNFCKLGEAGQGLVRVLLSHLSNPHGATLYTEAGTGNLCVLVPICIASEREKRQLCEPCKVVPWLNSSIIVDCTFLIKLTDAKHAFPFCHYGEFVAARKRRESIQLLVLFVCLWHYTNSIGTRRYYRIQRQ